MNDVRIITYPFINAPNGFAQTLSEKQWQQLGKVLRKIHDTAVPKWIGKQLRKETYSPKWRTLVRALYETIEPDASDNHIALEFKSICKTKLHLIRQLVDSAEELAKIIQ